MVPVPVRREDIKPLEPQEQDAVLKPFLEQLWVKKRLPEPLDAP